jgi:hypothetical protein
MEDVGWALDVPLCVLFPNGMNRENARQNYMFTYRSITTLVHNIHVHFSKTLTIQNTSKQLTTLWNVFQQTKHINN